MPPSQPTKPEAKKKVSTAKPSAAKKDKAKLGATGIHKELAPAVLNGLAAGFLARTDETWAQVATCVKCQMRSGPNATPDTDSKQDWADKSNKIASCVRKLPNYRGITQEKLASFTNRLWGKKKIRNDIIYEIYKRRDKQT
jgi:hypothetical protein